MSLARRAAFLLIVASRSAAASSCPPVTKVACPLCHDMLEQWNLDGVVPPSLDSYCAEVKYLWAIIREAPPMSN